MFEHLLEDNQLRPVLMEMADISEKDILFIKELIVGVIDKDTGMQAKTFPFQSAHIDTDCNHLSKIMSLEKITLKSVTLYFSPRFAQARKVFSG